MLYVQTRRALFMLRPYMKTKKKPRRRLYVLWQKSLRNISSKLDAWGDVSVVSVSWTLDPRRVGRNPRHLRNGSKLVRYSPCNVRGFHAKISSKEGARSPWSAWLPLVEHLNRRKYEINRPNATELCIPYEFDAIEITAKNETKAHCTGQRLVASVSWEKNSRIRVSAENSNPIEAQ